MHLHKFLFIIFYGGLAPFTLSAYSSQLFHPCTRGFFNSLVYIYIVHYHACVANNRFIGCLVANFFHKINHFVSLRLPTRSSPRFEYKTKRDKHLAYLFSFGAPSGTRTQDPLIKSKFKDLLNTQNRPFYMRFYTFKKSTQHLPNLKKRLLHLKKRAVRLF